jgi:hypothetical protein
MLRFLTIALTLVVLMVAGVASASTAELQVIHNAADPAAAVVDVYVNDGPDPFIDNFGFREATPFVEVPAGVNLHIGIAGGNSSGPGNYVAEFDVTLEAGNRYVAIANGVLDPDAFTPNPDGQDIEFTLFTRDRMKTRTWRNWVKIIGFHGSTDAPTVDIRVRDQYGHSWTTLRSLTYGEFSSYRTLRKGHYELDVTLPGDPSTVVASYAADLSGLGGGAAVVFASGFLAPARDAAFGLFAALPDGTVLELPALDVSARLQVIHNAADPAAAVVDIYVNAEPGDDPFINDFAFRAATPYVDVPAGVPLSIGVAPGNSSGPEDIIGDPFVVTLAPNQKYVAIANGVLGPGFDPNPDGMDIAFTLFPRDGMREYAHFGLVNLIAFHGATDAPSVDVILRGRWWPRRLADNLTYGEFSRYQAFLPRSFEVDVTLADDNSAVVATYEADLGPAAGLGVTVFASGFLNDAQGAAFGLFAALPDGTVLELPPAGAREARGGEEYASQSYSFALHQNRPNPFNPVTNIAFALPETQDVTITIYNANGRVVKTLLNERRTAGEHNVRFDADGLSSGVYFYRIDAGPNSEIRKMTLLK